MRIVDRILPKYSDFYITIGRTIYVPKYTKYIPESFLRHELVHVKQWDRWGIMLPIAYALPWFRWRIEAPAFLEEIRLGELTPEQSAEEIFWRYFFPWPRTLMVRWFKRASKS